MRTIKQFTVYEHAKTKNKYCVLGTSTPIESIHDIDKSKNLGIIRVKNTEKTNELIDVIHDRDNNLLYHYKNRCDSKLVIYRDLFLRDSIVWGRYEDMFKDKIIHNNEEIYRFTEVILQNNTKED